MTFIKRNSIWLLALCFLLFSLACGLTGGEPTPELPPPVVTDTAPAVNEEQPLEGGGQATAVSEEPTPTLAPTEDVEPATAVPTVDIDIEVTYRVIHVDENDILNVRSGPGIENGVVASLEPGSGGVRIVGFGQIVGDSTWVPINVNETSSWVNSRFLTEEIPSDEFCNDPETAALLDQLKTAIQNRDGEALAAISNPERGLRFRRYWWSEGVRFENQQINNLFNLTQSYFWGVADGSGEDINGSFSEIMLPLLERDLLEATEIGCNEILSGGTAGIIQPPPRYEGANYYSLYRPASPEQELDWGSWVIGIERWQGTYFVSFLVHYQWEI